MPDYSKGKIYKIICDETDRCYIGSTVQSLTKRFQDHKYKHTSWKNGKSKSFIRSSEMFEEHGRQNCSIELIENYPCDNKKELERREGYYIKNNNCYNKAIAGRTHKEYNEDNKLRLSEQFDCACGGKYSRSSKTNHLNTLKHEDYLRRLELGLIINITNLTINN